MQIIAEAAVLHLQIHGSAGGAMSAFGFVVVQSDPAIVRVTVRIPKANASTLLVLSGPVTCRKKTG
jgi:hypothetical protein